MGHITQAKELLEKQKVCKHTHIAYITEDHRYIPQGYAQLQEQDEIDLEALVAIDIVNKTVCLDCGLQLD